jgi:hypothetical protein
LSSVPLLLWLWRKYRRSKQAGFPIQPIRELGDSTV